MVDFVPFIDLAAQRERIRAKLDAQIENVIESGKYILGPQVTELEQKLAEFGQAGFALGCANGTDAIALPLAAWGIRPGDAVFVPSFTFASTAEVVAWMGASVVFVDIDPDLYTMDPESLRKAIEMVEADGELRPAAVIAVDMFGQPANYPEINDIARAKGMKLIADSAQGYGCTLGGQHPIHWADVATVSFYPAKPLGAYGDGGAMLGKDEALHELLKSLHVHGMGADRYEYARIGMNSRLDTIQAAILLEKLAIFADEIRARNEAADRYAAALSDVVKTPKVIDGGVSTWAQYTIEVDDRDGFRAALAEKGIPTAVYYPIPMHKHEPYAKYPVVTGGLPATDAAAERVVSLPMDAYLDGERQQRVIDAVKAAVG